MPRTSFFWTSNGLKCIYLYVIKFEHLTFGFERTDIKYSSTIANFDKIFASCQNIVAKRLEKYLATPGPENLKAIAHKTLYLCTKFISLEFFRVNQLCNFLKWCSRKISWSCLYCCENKKSKLVPQRKRFWNIKIFLFGQIIWSE